LGTGFVIFADRSRTIFVIFGDTPKKFKAPKMGVLKKVCDFWGHPYSFSFA